MIDKIFSKNASKKVKALRYAAYTALGLYAGQLTYDIATDVSFTDTEKQTLKHVFKDSLDVESITVRKSKITDYMIEVIGSEAFAYGDTMYLHTAHDANDPYNLKPWLLLHESTHLWQHKHCDTGNPPPLPYAIVHDAYIEKFFPHEERQNVSYRYRLTDDRDLADYNREQQASIIADYFAIKAGRYAVYLDLNQSQIRDMPLYESVMKNFLEDPSYIKNNCQNILNFDPKAGL